MGKPDAMTRIDARIPSHVKEIVARAASIQGRSQTDFLIAALSEAAQKVITDDAVIQLCVADQRTLAAALLEDMSSPSVEKLPRLRRAAKKHSRKVAST